MAASIPRPSLPPPTSALPLLPSPKLRKSLPPSPDASRSPSTSQLSSKLNLRAPTQSIKASLSSPSHRTNSTPSIPTLRSPTVNTDQETNSPSKDVRRSVSIASFPQPPKVGRRLATDPKSGSSSSDSHQRTSDSSSSPRISASILKVKKSKPSNEQPLYTPSGAPSLLNGSGDGKAISGAAGARGSDGLTSLLSPSQSRSSSAQGSYSTSATTFEDVDENARRAREEAVDVGRDSRRHSVSKEVKGNVLVSVRVRPDVGGTSDKSEGEWMVDGRRSLVAYRGRERGDYYYDNVFAAHDKNHKVYDASAKRLVRRVMEGYHGTVFAYGMTGTGKTFSMQGTATSPGVIPLAITDIFSYIRETPHREFLLRVSYLEIYNEKINDLLSPMTVSGSGPGASQPEEIKLREDSKRGVYASPLKEEIVQSPTQLLRVIARGDHSRRTRSTQFNAQSSRSHAVVQIVVESRERAPLTGSASQSKRTPLLPGGVRVSTLSMIDLAGSERAAENKERRTEGAHINKSLLTLGTVIARLSGDKDSSGNPTDKDGKHLPYRDSKLTRLLQPALSGNSLVSILCTIQIGSMGSVATANGHTGETLSTLKFASRAKNNIVSHAKRAEEAIGGGADSGSRVLLERYRMEIQTLRSQLDSQSRAQEEKEERQLEKEANQRHEEQMLEMQLARTALKERIEHLNRLILSSKSTGVNSNGKFSALSIRPNLASYHAGSSSRSLRSSPKSLRSSASHSTLGAITPSLDRTGSVGSTVTIGGQGFVAQSPRSSLENDVEEEDSTGEFGDGTATSTAHIRALQADLADKNRYISTLEKRLLQARRSSQSRTSLAFSPSSQKASGLAGDDLGVMVLMQEKDAEIADLRVRLDDKDRMLVALRSAARKRELAGLTPDTNSPEKGKSVRHHSNDSSDSANSGEVAFGPIGPVELLSPQNEKDKDKDKKRRSIDEMSKILDEMIQDRVESGQLVKGTKGTMRPVHERRKESLSAVPGVSSLMASTLRPPSTIPEAELSA
ncbi:hypothetical protein MMC07_003303 [Pseudocyphellaria aurata]|nr:hypothetical protein [Pseudocyphellaria aurata]